MRKVVDVGIDGVTLELGDHICGLYAGPAQRDEILIPFLRAGLRAGDKCICVIDGTEPSSVVAGVGERGHASSQPGPNQLDVIRSADMYLRSGRFSAAEIIDAWKMAIAEVMYGGSFSVVRAIETWSRRDVVPDQLELLTLESEMNRYLPLYPQVVLCLYDIDRFGGGLVVDLLKTHRRVLVGGMLLENPYRLAPDEVLAAEPRTTDVLASDREEAAEWCYRVTTGST